MFRVIFEIYRHQDLTREEFAARWTEHGSSLVSRFPGLRGYTQCLVLGSERLESAEADGISILDFDSEADYRRADSSPEMQAAHDDAATLVSRTTAYFVSPEQIS
jgi:uncharacterized protein (TIGR02118 family)